MDQPICHRGGRIRSSLPKNLCESASSAVPCFLPMTGGLRARRAHASERRMCITVGAVPGGRRTYGKEAPPCPPARRAVLQNF